MLEKTCQDYPDRYILKTMLEEGFSACSSQTKRAQYLLSRLLRVSPVDFLKFISINNKGVCHNSSKNEQDVLRKTQKGMVLWESLLRVRNNTKRDYPNSEPTE